MIVYTYTSTPISDSKGGAGFVAKFVSKLISTNYSVEFISKNESFFKLLYIFRQKLIHPQILINHNPLECTMKKLFFQYLIFNNINLVIHSEPDYIEKHVMFEKSHLKGISRKLLLFRIRFFTYIRYRLIFAISDKVILISKTHIDYFENKFSQKLCEKIEIITNPIYINQQGLNKSFNIRNNVVYIGRLVPIKRVDFLVKSWAHLTKISKMLNINLYLNFNIIGDGPEKKSLEKLITLENINNISMLGHLNSIEKQLNNSKILFLASHYEGTPQVIVEAQSKGVVPIVLNSFLAAKHMIVHGYNGFLIDASNEESFAEQCFEIITKNDLTIISNNCIKTASKISNIDIQNSWIDLIKNYE